MVKKKQIKKHQQKVWSKQVVIMYGMTLWIWDKYLKFNTKWNYGWKMCRQVCNSMWVSLLLSMRFSFFLSLCAHEFVHLSMFLCTHDFGITQINRKKPPWTLFICKSHWKYKRTKVRWSKNNKTIWIVNKRR